MVRRCMTRERQGHTLQTIALANEGVSEAGALRLFEFPRIQLRQPRKCFIARVIHQNPAHHWRRNGEEIGTVRSDGCVGSHGPA